MSKPVAIGAIVILAALSWAPLCIGADFLHLHLTLPALLCWCAACGCAAALAVLTLMDGGPRR